METESFLEAVRNRRKPRAIICDIDDTLCSEFARPIVEACRVMAAVDRAIEVHYVTARPEASRAGTEQFIADQRLPGRRNLHFCPTWKSSRTHKMEVIQRLAKEYEVIVSIGDHDEDEQASQAAGVPFVRVCYENLEQTWDHIAELIARNNCSSGS